MSVTVTEKACSKCGVVKAAIEFNRHRKKKSGLNPQCRQCCKDYREANRELIAEQRRESHARNRDKRNARSRAYHEKNREARLACKRAYHEANREKDNARQREAYALLGDQYNKKVQAMTKKHKTRYRVPWSEEEDKYLITSLDRIVDDALALRRTHAATSGRLARLRARGVVLARDEQ